MKMNTPERGHVRSGYPASSGIGAAAALFFLLLLGPAAAVGEAGTIDLKIDKVYTNEMGWPHADVTVTNRAGKGLYSVDVECHWTKDGTLVARGIRTYFNLPDGWSDQEKVYDIKNVRFDKVKCHIPGFMTNKERQESEDKFGKGLTELKNTLKQLQED